MLESGPLLTPLHTSIRVKHVAVVANTQKTYLKVDTLSQDDSTSEFLVFNDTPHNTLRAINERLLFKKVDGCWVKPIQPMMNSISLVRRLVKEHLRVTGHQTPYSRIDYVELYVGSKRKVMENALASYINKPYSIKDSYINAFLKIEKLPVKPTKPFEDMIGRIVQAASPRHRLEVGRYLKKIEHIVFEDIDRMISENCGLAQPSRCSIFKSLNAQQRGQLLRKKWDNFGDPVALAFDATRFDQSCSEPILKLENSIYPNYFHLNKHKQRLSQLLAYQVKNKCYSYPKGMCIKNDYTGRCSGHNNTALGNCLITACVAFTCFQTLRQEHPTFSYEISVDGDDWHVICDSKWTTLVSECVPRFFLECGFVLSVEPVVKVFEKIEFCQSQSIFDGSEWLMVRRPITSLTKDAIILKRFPNSQHFASHLINLGKCGLASTLGLPVLTSYYSCLLRNGENILGGRKIIHSKIDPWSGMSVLAKGMCRTQSTIPDSARESYFNAFDVDYDQQLMLENYYDKLTFTDEQRQIPDPNAPTLHF